MAARQRPGSLAARTRRPGLLRRTATSDTELGAQRIEAGQKVVMYYGAANRDPRVFAEPDRFDIERSPNEHLAFGGG